MRPIMTYGSNLNSDHAGKKALSIFEKVVVRKIYGQVKGERWRIRKNKEILDFRSGKLL
jgi:hypothetical protein